MSTSNLPLLTGLLILVIAVVAGPVFGIPSAQSEAACNVQTPIGTGQASVSVADLPDSAVLKRSRFGTETWTLDVDPVQVDIGSVSGRPTVAYKLRIEGKDLKMAAGSTATLSRCHNTTRIATARPRFSPRTLEQDTYNGTSKITYRGSQDGEEVEKRIATKNITVRVER